MKIGLFLYVCLASCFATPVFAARKADRSVPVDAGRAEKPEMAVRIDEGRPVYIHKNKSFDCSGPVNHGGGCTRVRFYASVGGVEMTPDGAIAKIDLRVGLKNVEVELSSDLEKGSCLFDAVLKHELTHLALHRRILKRFAPEIAKAVLAVVEDLPAPLTQAHVDKVDKVLKGYVARMMAEDQKQNDLMDSREAYLHLQNQCRE